MAKADIWMPFYVADYLADTMHLSPAEHGAYLLLILHYWKSGPLVDDDSRLSTISRMGDAWSNASSTIKAFFEQRDGMLYHKRIDREKAEANANKDRNHARAQAAAAKRWGKDASSNAPSNVSGVLADCPSPSPSPSIKAKSKASALATRLPADWVPSDADLAFCQTKRPDLSPPDVADSFRDYWISVPGARGRKEDWPATWRNWVRNQGAKSNGANHGKNGSSRAGRVSDTIAELTGANRHPSPVIPGTAERVD